MKEQLSKVLKQIQSINRELGIIKQRLVEEISTRGLVGTVEQIQEYMRLCEVFMIRVMTRVPQDGANDS